MLCHNSLAGMACQLYTTLVDLVVISHGQMMALDIRDLIGVGKTV